MTKETIEISTHLLGIFCILREQKRWMTSKHIAEATKISPRTARAHLLRLVSVGLVDQAPLFPEHRYRISDPPSKEGKPMLLRLLAAEQIFNEGAQ